ncbi:hypothetical protein AB1K83_11315 [Sporosarcina sp. 179-K 3D1 HS]|uniref:hypothetical protein n=1 Tax=Sporosarcina sp. 179-K 3D1 HS TaxID=3232169 RepID=UPI00399F606D
MEKRIYIVLTDTGTLLSKSIALYTKDRLNHVSIAFDAELRDMYSFGRKRRHNPFIGGFVKEDATTGILGQAQCAVFSCTVSLAEYEKMRRAIGQFEENPEQYRYNFIGLFAVAMKKEIRRENAFFCSQFVATVMNEGGISLFSWKPHFVQPGHFAQLPHLRKEYEGSLQTYFQRTRGTEERPPLQSGLWRGLALRLLA